MFTLDDNPDKSPVERVGIVDFNLGTDLKATLVIASDLEMHQAS
jgi:hypothetical protein